jgi:hypothetical protein
MVKEKGEVYRKSETFPFRVGKPEPRKRMYLTGDKLEASIQDGLEPKSARVAGADDFPGGRFKQMPVFGEQRSAAKFASLDLLRGRARSGEAPERSEGRYTAR